MYKPLLSKALLGLIVVLLVSSCQNPTSTNFILPEWAAEYSPYTGSLDSSEIGEPFSASTYGGMQELGDGAGDVTCSLIELTLTTPSMNRLIADAYFTIAGEVAAYDGTDQDSLPDIERCWLEVAKGGEATTYWLEGDFDQKIWLRFGAGLYTVSIYRLASIDINSQNVAMSWGYYTAPALSFHVYNVNPEDGRALYPSAVIQSLDTEIVDQADGIAGSSGNVMDDLIEPMHDWVVQALEYDHASLDTDNRKPQDAVTCLGNSLAVCEGYSTLYAALLRARSVPAAFVSGIGYTSDGEGLHAWNRVSDGTQWKLVDATWDDPGGSSVRHDYFWKDTLVNHSTGDVETDRAVVTISSSSRFPGYPDGWY